MRDNDLIYSNYLLDRYKKNDFLDLSTDIKKYDWCLFESFVEKISYIEILESFVLKSSNYDKNGGLRHVYEIETLKKDKFEVILNYADPEDSYSLANKNEIIFNKKNNNELANNFNILKNVLASDNGVVCMLMFKDSQGDTSLTGKVNIVSGLELFRTLNDVLKDSFSKITYTGNVDCVGIRIYNTEKERRLPFYQYLHNRYWSNIFPNKFIDEESEKESNITILYIHR